MPTKIRLCWTRRSTKDRHAVAKFAHCKRTTLSPSCILLSPMFSPTLVFCFGVCLTFSVPMSTAPAGRACRCRGICDKKRCGCWRRAPNKPQPCNQLCSCKGACHDRMAEEKKGICVYSEIFSPLSESLVVSVTNESSGKLNYTIEGWNLGYFDLRV